MHASRWFYFCRLDYIELNSEFGMRKQIDFVEPHVVYFSTRNFFCCRILYDCVLFLSVLSFVSRIAHVVLSMRGTFHSISSCSLESPLNLHRSTGQIVQGSFSAVSTPNLGRAFKRIFSIYMQNLASIQPRTSLVKFPRSPYAESSLSV